MSGESFTNLWFLQGKASIKIPELQCLESLQGGESICVLLGSLVQLCGNRSSCVLGPSKTHLHGPSSDCSCETFCNVSCEKLAEVSE